jgi:histone acetyltransferase MYST1
MQVLVERQGGDKISIKELADITAIKTEDVISTLQYLNLIQYDRGQHVIIAAPTIIAE